MSAPTQKNLQNPDPLVYTHVVDNFGTKFVNQAIRRPNSIIVPRVSGEELHITGNSYLFGPIITPLVLSNGLIIPSGSPSTPAIRFAGDLDTGIYQGATGELTLVSDGQPILSTTPTAISITQQISTQSGNIILNPAGGAVDFSGAALINFSGISQNANFYSVVSSANVDTFGATAATLVSVTTDTDSVYTLEISASCLSVTDNVSGGSFVMEVRAQNIGGVVTIFTAMESSASRDAAILTSFVDLAVSGTTILVQANGTAGHVVRWFGGVNVTRMKKI